MMIMTVSLLLYGYLLTQERATPVTASIRYRNQSRVGRVTIPAQISRCYASYITLDFGVVNLHYRNRTINTKNIS
jgi:hypothetical protein